MRNTKEINDLLDELETTGELGKDGEELFNSFHSLPAVQEYMNSFSVQLGMAIVAERTKHGLSQRQLADLVEKETGKKMAQSTISKIEGGHSGIKGETYDKVFKALGLSVTTLPTAELASRERTSRTKGTLKFKKG